jgi:hypothetical protein
MVIVANESAAGVRWETQFELGKSTKISVEIGVGGRGLVRGQPATEGKSGALVLAGRSTRRARLTEFGTLGNRDRGLTNPRSLIVIETPCSEHP